MVLAKFQSGRAVHKYNGVNGIINIIIAVGDVFVPSAFPGNDSNFVSSSVWR